MFDLGFREWKRVRGMVERGEVSWSSPPAREQDAMDRGVAMLREAADQGHVMAQHFLGALYDSGEGVPQSYERAAEWYAKAAEQGLPE